MAAEIAPRLPPRFGGGEPGLDAALRLHLEMKRDLVP